MAVLLASMIAWATFVSPVTSRASLRGDALSTLGYAANWRFIVSGQGYFDHFGPQSPLLHTWSVSVEEQFYLVWPLLLLLVLRWRRRGVFALAFVGATASAIWTAVLSLRRCQPRPAVLRHRHPRAAPAARLRARGAAAPRRDRGIARADAQGRRRTHGPRPHPADRARRSSRPRVRAGCARPIAAPGSTAAASSSSRLPPRGCSCRAPTRRADRWPGCCPSRRCATSAPSPTASTSTTGRSSNC